MPQKGKTFLEWLLQKMTPASLYTVRFCIR